MIFSEPYSFLLRNKEREMPININDRKRIKGNITKQVFMRYFLLEIRTYSSIFLTIKAGKILIFKISLSIIKISLVNF